VSARRDDRAFGPAEEVEMDASRPPKVFGIGFHKTATTSLRAALRHLGYDVTGPNGAHDADIADTYREMAREISARHDAFQDNPWPLVYREMDAMWPGAKFILTTRDPEAWIASQVKYFGTAETPMRRLIYGEGRGSPVGNEAHYKAVFEAHNAEARAHFRGREADFLEIDLTRRPDWAPICALLGHDVPAIRFPHANSSRAASTPRALRWPMRVARKIRSLLNA
jgi:hypothetical protein